MRLLRVQILRRAFMLIDGRDIIAAVKKMFRYSSVFLYNHLYKPSVFQILFLKSGIICDKSIDSHEQRACQFYNLLKSYRNVNLSGRKGEFEILKRADGWDLKASGTGQ